VDVLIADDDLLIRKSLRSLLERQGYRCVEAGDGREAVEMARHQPPQCVLLDLAMPGLDGLAVARRLRGDPRTRGVRIHCLTGLAGEEVRAEALQAGCETFLPKPVDAARLLEVVGEPNPALAENTVGGLSSDEARNLLDWLQNNGCAQLGASLSAAGWAVRCEPPPGLRLGRDEQGRVRLLPA
jgi:two-component system phosphate regulon response regulator PhoB